MRLARRRGGGNGVFRLSLPLPLCIFRIFAWQEHDERMNKSKQTQENTASGEPSYITGYVRYLWLEEGLSDNTRKAYREDLQRFLDFAAERGIDVLKADLAVFHDFVYVLHSMGISARSIARIVSGIRSFYHFLEIDGYLPANPAVLLEAPRIGRHLPTVLTLDEVNRIEDAIDLGEPEGVRNLAIIELLYSAGLRVSELCQLRLSALYLTDGYIQVLGKGQKVRLVPLSPAAIMQLRRWLEQRADIEPKPGEEDYVFLSLRRRSHLSTITVFHIVKVLAEAAGIQKNISPHTFRHTFATHLLEGGANLRVIQTLLGHESITTTEIYTHLDLNNLRRQVLEHFPRNLPSGDDGDEAPATD